MSCICLENRKSAQYVVQETIARCLCLWKLKCYDCYSIFKANFYQNFNI
jgi:hypothetical protein